MGKVAFAAFLASWRQEYRKFIYTGWVKKL